MTTPPVQSEPILIACCGQHMAGDDAFGMRVAERLRTLPLPETKIVELADRPSQLLDHLPGPQMLIVVDAVKDPSKEAGQQIEMDWFGPDRSRLALETAVSSHGLSVVDQINLAERLGICPPRVFLFGCTIDSARVGQIMQRSVHQQVSITVDRVGWFIESFMAQQAGAS